MEEFFPPDMREIKFYSSSKVSNTCRRSDILLNDNVATIHGQKELYSAPVMCTDIRASAALVIAALCAKGKKT